MKRKLDIVKSRTAQEGVVSTKIELDQTEQVEQLKGVKESINKLWELINDKKDFEPDMFVSQLEDIAKAIDIKDQVLELRTALKIPEAEPIDFTPVIKAIEKNKPEKLDLSKFEKAIIEVTQRVQESNQQASQATEDYQPVRRVVKIGQRLVYDDQPTPANIRGGGGGSSSGGGLTDAELRASPVPVEATIDTTGLATDTGQDAQTALLTTIDADTGAIKTAVETLDNAISGSEMQVDVVAALPAGNNNIGDVDVASLPGDVEADIDQIRDQIDAQNTGSSTMNASSSDGATALTNTAQVIKASAGRLTGYFVYNPNATAQFVQFYNTAAASVTVGTTNPLFMITIPATSAANLWMGEDGPNFSNAGWSWAATSTAGGNGAPGSALDAVAWYK